KSIEKVDCTISTTMSETSFDLHHKMIVLVGVNVCGVGPLMGSYRSDGSFPQSDNTAVTASRNYSRKSISL
ncbi:hypothetical protein A2U01_0051783, partial [Trifolium medium]|nr:hypothetical protein [Trifolium medium]